jgi:hypothetical protein
MLKRGIHDTLASIVTPTAQMGNWLAHFVIRNS